MGRMTQAKQMVPRTILAPTLLIWRRTLGRTYPRRSWSQGGEDLVLLELLGSRPPGRYVDVGAFHPAWGSNTHALYKLGWCGVNVDARPGSMKPFRRARRNDVNLELGVGPESAALNFYVFADDELSTFDASLARARSKTHRLIDTVQVDVVPLKAIIERHSPAGVDLLLIDAEGYDLAVLESNDWDAYRPDIVVVEVPSMPQRLTDAPVVHFMATVGYRPVAATGMNVFFSSQLLDG